MSRSGRTYTCDCARYCKSRSKVVSERTFYRHAEYRSQLPISYADWMKIYNAEIAARAPAPSLSQEAASRKRALHDS
ncbi:hypothetical protein DENSPDRAFT_843007 [Dentipellis sp. KUC8613]|nr:hypothetical protein DENSPDRAFT_843007 [Dentipellis sp. KUC8613]